MSVRRPFHVPAPVDEHGGDVTVQDGPVADPGIVPHLPRITDIDPAAANRAERQVAGMFGLATLLTIGFCVAYFAVDRDLIIRVGPLRTQREHADPRPHARIRAVPDRSRARSTGPSA